MKSFTKRVLAIGLSAAMVLSMGVSTFALDGDIDADQEQASLLYDYPTSPMDVDSSYITASAHRAASPVLGIMGLNATSGFGMINGGAPADLEAAQKSAAVGIWGSSLNSNPDPYYWNYFYNFYANSEAGKAAGAVAVNGTDVAGGTALINANVSGSPSAADTTLVPEFGNVSYSLVSRPDILIGVDGGTEETSYDAQIATINSYAKDSEYYREGDESYSPIQVKYAMTYIKQMIESVQRIADAVDETIDKYAAQGITKTTRYGDCQVIAADYETYVYGLIAYIQSQLAADGEDQKVVAVVNGIYEQEDADGNKYNVYAIADDLATSATSLVRAVEYTMPVCTSILETIDYGTMDVESTGRDGSVTTSQVKTVTLDDLLKADVIVTINNTNISAETLNASFGDKTYDGIEITKTPAALYGVTMNSVENAMGYAYVIASCYPEYINSVEVCAYFYEHFYHVSEIENIAKVVRTNFADLTGESGTTLTSTYSAEAIEEKLAEGARYFVANKDAFSYNEYYDANHIGLADWEPDFTTGILTSAVVIDGSENGFVNYMGGKFFMNNGAVDTAANGLVQDIKNVNDWYYCALGQAQTQYTGLAQYDGAWFYITNGKLDTKLAAVVDYDGGKFLVAAGRILTEVSGISQDPLSGTWYYFADGQAQTQYTGLAQYDGAWFYIVNGVLAENYTGTVQYDGSTFNVVNGMVK